MKNQYYFYSKKDKTQEPISKTITSNRLSAAKYFSAQKELSLKQFLQIYSVSR